MRFQTGCFAVAACLVLPLLAGCASAHRPGTGDIAFRLYWQGEEDLDLHVVEPSGAEIYFLQRKAESGGELDVDCNAAPDRICWTPIENVFWPVGKAADGDYVYWVDMFQAAQAKQEVPFTLQVLLGEHVVRTVQGTVGVALHSSPKQTFPYRRNAVPKVTSPASGRRPRSGSPRP
jgi:hypothetical protein